MKVAAVVLNFNGIKNTLDCVESLKKQTLNAIDFQIIVVDNCSQDDSVKTLKSIQGIKLIENDKNLGYAGGMNVGIKYAMKNNFDKVVLLNNDIYADKAFLTNIVNASKKADIVAPKIYFAPGHEFHRRRYRKEDLGKVIWFAGSRIDWQNIIGYHVGVDGVDKGQFNRSGEIDFASGACMLISKEVFEQIGYFDEKYFLYLEDMDFCFRAKLAGFKIVFEPRAVIWHKNAQSTGGSGSALQDYYITRNRLLFAFKFAKLKTKLALFKQVLLQINHKAKRRAFFDFMTFNFQGPKSQQS